MDDNKKEQWDYLDSDIVKTYGDLLGHLKGFTEEELKQEILVQGEDFADTINSITTLKCDYINPSGECAEPLDYYKQFNEDDGEYLEDIENEEVVMAKGTRILSLSDERIDKRLEMSNKIVRGDFSWDATNGVVFTPNPIGKWTIVKKPEEVM